MAVSVAVCGLFSVKEWCDLENRIRVRSRSFEMAPFDRSHTSSYSPSVVTMALACIVSRYSDILVENREMFIPHLYLAPLQGWPRRNFVKFFDADKTRMIGYRMVKKLWQHVKLFLSDTGMWRTDGRTDRQTDRIAISISRVSVLTRDKNWHKLTESCYINLCNNVAKNCYVSCKTVIYKG